MTENEAKGWLIELKDCEETQEFYYADCIIETLDIAIKALEEIQQYRAIGTMEEFKALKEKHMAKKISGKRFEEAICPRCESELFETYWAFGGIHYCSNCGQAIDWSEENE